MITQLNRGFRASTTPENFKCNFQELISKMKWIFFLSWHGKMALQQAMLIHYTLLDFSAAIKQIEFLRETMFVGVCVFLHRSKTHARSFCLARWKRFVYIFQFELSSKRERMAKVKERKKKICLYELRLLHQS